MLDSRNPAFNRDINGNTTAAVGVPMTVQGTLTKTIILSLIMCISGAATWYQFALGYMDKVNMFMFGGLIIGLIVAFVIMFKQHLAPVLAPVYAFAEGALLGGLSAIFEAQFPGIVVQAVSLTMLAVFSMAVLYKIGLIRATERFRSTILIATSAVAIFYLIDLVGRFFHFNLSIIYSSSPLGIAFSLFVVGLAALNLIIDFDFIEKGQANFLPQYYEWYGAFGLLITIVWLYLEILRLLSKLKER